VFNHEMTRLAHENQAKARPSSSQNVTVEQSIGLIWQLSGTSGLNRLLRALGITGKHLFYVFVL